jgi:hypothetical protein
VNEVLNMLLCTARSGMIHELLPCVILHWSKYWKLSVTAHVVPSEHTFSTPFEYTVLHPTKFFMRKFKNLSSCVFFQLFFGIGVLSVDFVLQSCWLGHAVAYHKRVKGKHVKGNFVSYSERIPISLNGMGSMCVYRENNFSATYK